MIESECAQIAIEYCSVSTILDLLFWILSSGLTALSVAGGVDFSSDFGILQSLITRVAEVL